MNFLKIKLFVIALIMFAASSAFASLTFDVSIDTSAFTSQEGYLYFQYTPVNGADSTVTLSNFIMDGSGLHATPSSQASSVTGAIYTTPTVVFANTLGTNDYNHGVNEFADKFTFSLTFSTPAPGGQPGGSSTFSLGMFQDEAGTTPLFNIIGINNSVAGTLFTIDLNNDGTTTVQTLANEATVTATPIPAAVWLLGSGLLGLTGLRRRTGK